jgi:non-canonical purine NTP pyrophosphatase (RdgB/HAM1 family)
MNLYIITGNKGKFAEFKAILKDVEMLNLNLEEIQEINPEKIVEFKLFQAKKHASGEFIVEDSSLSLDCLNGLPGPLIKWFEKTIGLDGIYNIAKSLKNDNASAIIGYIDKDEKISFFEGNIKGNIVSPRGENGFGWDKIFVPEGFDKTFAEMTNEEKNKISHRKKAIEKLKDFLSTK